RGCDTAFRPDLGRSVGSDRVQRAVLVQHRFARLAVVTARRGQQEAPHPTVLVDGSGPGAAKLVDLIREFGPQMSEMIVRQGSEMDDGVDSLEILALDVANVFADGWYLHDAAARSESAALVKVAVEANHFVARLEQHRSHDSPDVSQVPRQHYAHCRSPLLSG